MSTFPIICKLAPRFVAELSECEYGSYEDHHHGKDGGRYGTVHAVDILKRRASGIEVRDADEAAEIYYSVCSGTFQLAYESGQGFPGALAQARRIANELRPYVAADVVRYWRGPTGY